MSECKVKWGRDGLLNLLDGVSVAGQRKTRVRIREGRQRHGIKRQTHILAVFHVRKVRAEDGSQSAELYGSANTDAKCHAEGSESVEQGRGLRLRRVNVITNTPPP